jgi:diguanylate cyclase (GGDEF)-like protein
MHKPTIWLVHAESQAFEGSWLCPTPLDRARLLDLDDLLNRSWTLIEVLMPLTAILSAWRVGPWALLPLVCTPAFALLPAIMRRVRKPEWALLATLLAFVLTLNTAVALTGGVRSPMVFWMVFYMVGCATRFARRALALATSVGAAAIIAAVAAPDPAHVWHDLPVLVTLLAVCIVAGRYTRVLTVAEYDHRQAALIDPLTGLLNRQALESRFEQERQHAVDGAGPLCVVLCDLDHFKAVNDRHGHERGDAVLREAAAAMRHSLRSSERIFRIGGEEFLILLPGVTGAEGAAVAERVRHAVAQAEPGGLTLTASFGVAATDGPGTAFDILFREADTALYTAKSQGRDRVVLAGQPAELRAA